MCESVKEGGGGGGRGGRETAGKEREGERGVLTSSDKTDKQETTNRA